jgi:hypothetical protein
VISFVLPLSYFNHINIWFDCILLYFNGVLILYFIGVFILYSIEYFFQWSVYFNGVFISRGSLFQWSLNSPLIWQDTLARDLSVEFHEGLTFTSSGKKCKPPDLPPIKLHGSSGVWDDTGCTQSRLWCPLGSTSGKAPPGTSDADSPSAPSASITSTSTSNSITVAAADPQDEWVLVRSSWYHYGLWSQCSAFT